MLRVEKVASPATAATVLSPERAPPDGFVPIATATLPLKPGTVFPTASRAVTSTGGARCAPAAVVAGCMLKASCAADPGLISNGSLVASARPVAAADSVYAVLLFTVPVLSMLRVEKVAIPPTAATVDVPESFAPPGPVPTVIVTVTLPAKPGTRLPSGSCAATCTAGAIVAPPVAVLGCAVKTSWVAPPAVMANGALVAPARPAAVAESL